MNVNSTMKHAVIVIGGDLPDPRALDHLDPHHVVICADSGLDHALTLGLDPHVLLGDMDSISAANLERSTSAEWIVIPFDRDKDQTDTELALQYAVDHQFAAITILWGSGDRIDHVLGVLAALAHSSLQTVGRLVAWIGSDRVEVLHGPKVWRDEVPLGSTISLMPLGHLVDDVTTNGLKWNLEGAELSPTTSRGVSNLSNEPTISISIGNGVLAVVYPGHSATLPRKSESPT